jgi:hypothetical protein
MKLEPNMVTDLQTVLETATGDALKKEAEYKGAVVALVMGELLGFPSMEHLGRSEKEYPGLFGSRVFAAEERGLVLDAVGIIELFASEGDFVVRDLPLDPAVEELQQLLDKWCSEKTTTTIYDSEFDIVVERKGTK